MGDDVPEEVKIAKELSLGQVVPEVYNDLLKPAAKELGKGLEATAKAVNLALAPIQGLVWGSEKIKAYLTASLTKRLQNLPAEQIVIPNPSVAGPAIEALKFNGHCPELRELFANLISASINANEAVNAHPAFVEVIKQISPDEARILRCLSTHSSYPTISQWNTDSVPFASSPERVYKFIYENITALCAEINFDNSDLMPNYVDNLKRLQLIEIIEPNSFLNEVFKWPFESRAKDYDAFKKEVAREVNRSPSKISKLVFTSLGQQFVEICVKSDLGNSSVNKQ